jgi:tetratricopeptide (TPR) repeat protein
LGRFEASIAYYFEALTVLRATGRRLGQSFVHIGLGYAYCGLRHFEQSIECFQTALEFVDDDPRSEGFALNGLGCGHRGLGRIEESIDYYERALVVFAKIGDWWGQGEVLYNLGMAQADAGRRDQARRSWAQALAIFHDLHIDRETEVRALLDGE